MDVEPKGRGGGTQQHFYGVFSVDLFQWTKTSKIDKLSSFFSRIINLRFLFSFVLKLMSFTKYAIIICGKCQTNTVDDKMRSYAIGYGVVAIQVIDFFGNVQIILNIISFYVKSK